MNRPEPLLSFSDYLEDLKSRVEIHNYEVKKLHEDVKFVFDLFMDKVYYKVVNNWYNREGNLPFFMPVWYNIKVTHL